MIKFDYDNIQCINILIKMTRYFHLCCRKRRIVAMRVEHTRITIENSLVFFKNFLRKNRLGRRAKTFAKILSVSVHSIYPNYDPWL